MDSALDGLKVLEISRFAAAPFCGKLLAGFGADVLKIEPPGTGDPARLAGPFPDGEPNGESSPPFLYLNTGKRSITLDVACKTGQAVLSRLVQSSDVLVHDFRPAKPIRWDSTSPR